MNDCGLILLAAGASTRLGKPKQLLPWQQKPLLQHMIEVALGANCCPVTLILGANASQLTPITENKDISVVYNPEWQEGMASSIRYGLTALLESAAGTEAVIFMVCDQPHVTAALLKDLIAAHQHSGKKIVASQYADTIGIPALFEKSLFPALLQLKGDGGAKRIIQQYSHEVQPVAFPMGYIDIDTAADYEKLTQNSQ
jgi:molybdenum cofactor cytidylyltransferase